MGFGDYISLGNRLVYIRSVVYDIHSAALFKLIIVSDVAIWGTKKTRST
jgi:hypothetical protein